MGKQTITNLREAEIIDGKITLNGKVVEAEILGMRVVAIGDGFHEFEKDSNVPRRAPKGTNAIVPGYDGARHLPIKRNDALARANFEKGLGIDFSKEYEIITGGRNPTEFRAVLFLKIKDLEKI
jgi:hypothetical protein